jgi:hypothetical protein
MSFYLSGGVEVLGFISPTEPTDEYPVIDPLYGIDGFRNVNTLSDLNSIPNLRRRAGMVVGVSGGEKYYKLKNLNDWLFDISDWLEIDLTKITYVDKETPTGNVDGVNSNFTLTYTPIPNSEHVYLNGLLQDEIDDYTIEYNVIKFTYPPLNGMKIRCSYRTK